jgi:hypothetical protein
MYEILYMLEEKYTSRNVEASLQNRESEWRIAPFPIGAYATVGISSGTIHLLIFKTGITWYDTTTMLTAK